MDKIYSRRRLLLPKLNISIFYKFKNSKAINYNREKNNKIIKFIKIIMILIIAIITAMKIIEAIEPILKAQCITRAKSIATIISNEQATKVMSRYNYDELCNIVKDSNGNISMISANVITINEIISDIPILIQKELEKEENNSFNLRLGTLTGVKTLSGRGPNLKIKIESIGNLDTDLKSEFENAGINQTLHRLYLQVDCNVIILTPFETIEEKISNQVLLTETVIMGTTPNTYYNLEGIDKTNLVDVIQ